jgi:xanthine phosphoribosyltransferase
LIPAQLIAYKLNIRDVRVMKLISYDENNVRGEINDISTDRLFDGQDVYFIDDLADSGATIRYVKKRFPMARMCSMLMKSNCLERPDICGREGINQNTWLVFPWD